MNRPLHLARGTFLPFALGLFAGCSSRAEQPAPYRLFDVVTRAVKDLDKRVPPVRVPEPEAANPEVRERIAGLVEAMASSDARIRNLAIEEAAGLPTAITAALPVVLADEQAAPVTRDGVARLLGDRSTPESGEVLCATLESSPNPGLRRQCAFQLGRVGQPQLVPRMLLRLKYELDGETVIWLAHALSRYGNLSGLDGLRVLTATARDENVRTLAAQVGADLATEFGAPDMNELERRWNSGAFEAERGIRTQEDRTLLEGWKRIERLSLFDLRQVDDARFALVALDGWITPLLAEALHDTNTYTRVHAAQCLERRGGRARDAVVGLIEALREPRVAPNAAVALGAIGDVRALEPILAALESGAGLDLRVACARALGLLNSRDALASLTRAFAVTQPADLRQAAAEALLAIDGRADAFDSLRSILATRTGDVDGAEAALGQHLAQLATGGDPHAVELEQRWRALDLRSGAISTATEAEARQRARSRLLQ